MWSVVSIPLGMLAVTLLLLIIVVLAFTPTLVQHRAETRGEIHSLEERMVALQEYCTELERVLLESIAPPPSPPHPDYDLIAEYEREIAVPMHQLIREAEQRAIGPHVHEWEKHERTNEMFCRGCGMPSGHVHILLDDPRPGEPRYCRDCGLRD